MSTGPIRPTPNLDKGVASGAQNCWTGRSAGKHHRISPKKWQNTRLSSDEVNPLSRSWKYQADGDGCVGSHLDAAAGSRV